MSKITKYFYFWFLLIIVFYPVAFLGTGLILGVSLIASGFSSITSISFWFLLFVFSSANVFWMGIGTISHRKELELYYSKGCRGIKLIRIVLKRYTENPILN